MKGLTSGDQKIANEPIPLPKGKYSVLIEMEGLSVQAPNQMPIQVFKITRFPSRIADISYLLKITDRRGNQVPPIKLKSGTYTQMGATLVRTDDKPVPFPVGMMDLSAQTEPLSFEVENSVNIKVSPATILDIDTAMINRVAQAGLGAVLLLFLFI